MNENNDSNSDRNTCHTDNSNEASNNCQLLEVQLCHRLYVISNAITRAYRPLLDSIELTYPQYVVMMALWEKEDVSISELQQKTKIDIGCLSLMLKKMVAKNMIAVVASNKDKRMKYIKLTEKGCHLQACAKEKKLTLPDLNPLSEIEFQTLIGLLDKFKAAF